MCNWFQNKSPTHTFAVDWETWHCNWAAPCYFNGASPTGSVRWCHCLQRHLACEGLYRVERQISGRCPTGLQALVRNRGQLEIAVTWSRNRSFKMAATNLGYLHTKLSFWLRLWHDWYISFLAWRQRIISLVCFANNAIHPWPQVMPIFDREMPPGFTPAICLHCNFVYISNLESRGRQISRPKFLRYCLQ